MKFDLGHKPKDTVSAHLLIDEDGDVNLSIDGVDILYISDDGLLRRYHVRDTDKKQLEEHGFSLLRASTA